jgi:hypothetical protein
MFPTFSLVNGTCSFVVDTKVIGAGEINPRIKKKQCPIAWCRRHQAATLALQAKGSKLHPGSAQQARRSRCSMCQVNQISKSLQSPTPVSHAFKFTIRVQGTARVIH